MPGSPLLHGVATSSSPAGEGGASVRAGAAAAPLSSVSFPTNWGFFLWLVVIGVVLPVFVLGGLRVGGFQFVFRGR